MGISSSDFGVSDKNPSSSLPPEPADSGGVGLGLTLQSTESLMMHPHRPSSPPSIPGPTPISGPNDVLGCRSINHTRSIYHDNIVAANANGFPVRSSLQPFHSSTSTAFNYPGMAATETLEMGYPFTASQWKELERQAMIYKYMVASVPVPYQLLLPITQNLSADSAPAPLLSQLRYTTKQDPEPGRCKRTDGKKWRCSRDVAPNQKYCERHMHRGRPRSRKHVEIPQKPSPNFNKKTRLDMNPNSSSPKFVGSTTILPYDTKNVQQISYRGSNRVGFEYEEQQWQHLMQGSIYDKNHSVFQQDFGEEPLNLFSYTDFGTSQDFPGSDIVSLEKEPRGFIDAWSNDVENKNYSTKDSSVSLNGSLSPSSLTLSMAMALGNSIDGELGQIQMGLGGSTTPGGPLAEVLRPSSVMVSSNPASPYAAGVCDGHSISPPTTTVSSPSGVLQRTMLSLSDSSVCNSPTLAASTTATPELVAFQWLT